MKHGNVLLRAALVLLAAAVINSWSPATASRINNQNPDCIPACDQLVSTCNNQCRNDCEVVYAGQPSQISACRTACEKVCLDQYKSCKLQCKYGECVPGDPEPCPQ